METDFSFQKLYLGDLPSAESAQQLIQRLDERCRENGLLPVDEETTSHFTYLLIESDTNWLHFASMGHFLPQTAYDYATVIQLLSDDFHLIDFKGKDGGPYVIRRYTKRIVSARYATYGDEGIYESRADAEPWFPVFTNWQGLLQPEITAEEFHALLPAPVYPGAPEPETEVDFFDLPEHFNRLFGWHRELNYAAVEFRPDGPDGRGDFYESEAGDYTDQQRGLRIFIRHYAHPDAGNKYTPVNA